jgi:hypothetical protein
MDQGADEVGAHELRHLDVEEEQVDPVLLKDGKGIDGVIGDALQTERGDRVDVFLYDLQGGRFVVHGEADYLFFGHIGGGFSVILEGQLLSRYDLFSTDDRF